MLGEYLKLHERIAAEVQAVSLGNSAKMSALLMAIRYAPTGRPSIKHLARIQDAVGGGPCMKHLPSLRERIRGAQFVHARAPLTASRAARAAAANSAANSG